MNCIILRHSTAQISLGAKESSIDSYPYTERSREIQKKVVEYMMLNTGELLIYVVNETKYSKSAKSTVKTLLSSRKHTMYIYN